MEIQKIFSNIDDQEEKLYSVLMSEEELSLFSEYQDKKKKSTTDKIVAGTAIGSGLTSMGLAAGMIGEESFRNKLQGKLARATEKIAKKTKTKVGTLYNPLNPMQPLTTFEGENGRKAAQMVDRYKGKLQGAFDKSIKRQNAMGTASKAAMITGATALGIGFGKKILDKKEEKKIKK